MRYGSILIYYEVNEYNQKFIMWVSVLICKYFKRLLIVNTYTIVILHNKPLFIGI